MKLLRPFREQNYRHIIDEVGPHNYCIYEKGESMPGEILRRELNIGQYNAVIAGTGCAIADYAIWVPHQENIVIPAGEPIMIFRLLRYDDTHGNPHYNANDQLIFPTKAGSVYRLVRNDAPDYFINIISQSNIVSIAEAYNLPEEKSGPVEKYSAKGARLHVDVRPLDDITP